MSADPDDDESRVGDDAGEGAQNLLDGIAAGFFDIVDGLVDFVDAILFTPADALEIAASGGDLGGVVGAGLSNHLPPPRRPRRGGVWRPRLLLTNEQ